MSVCRIEIEIEPCIQSFLFSFLFFTVLYFFAALRLCFQFLAVIRLYCIANLSICHFVTALCTYSATSFFCGTAALRLNFIAALIHCGFNSLRL
ncbi:hypothetical protein BZA77DRAFT_299692, partial [Pyronema omphalodes]